MMVKFWSHCCVLFVSKASVQIQPLYSYTFSSCIKLQPSFSCVHVYNLWVTHNLTTPLFYLSSCPQPPHTCSSPHSPPLNTHASGSSGKKLCSFCFLFLFLVLSQLTNVSSSCKTSLTSHTYG